jgi:hypothetical protein
MNKEQIEMIQQNPELISELVAALGWYLAFYCDVRDVAPEYFENCYDDNAARHLYYEASLLQSRITPQNITDENNDSLGIAAQF